MLPRENKNNAYAKFGGTNKEYYGIFRSGQLRSITTFVPQADKFLKCDCVRSVVFKPNLKYLQLRKLRNFFASVVV